MKLTKTLTRFLFLLLLTPSAFAEGVASMTNVTAANGKRLDHHTLAVHCRSQQGKTFIDLVVRPNVKTPFTNCSVSIFDKAGQNILVQFDPEIHTAAQHEELPMGSRVYFHVSDELLDHIKIRYHLHANAAQSHVFTIKRGELRKLAGIPQ